jgi:hypothetical protein
MGQIGLQRCEAEFEPLVRPDRPPVRLTPQPAQEPTAERAVERAVERAQPPAREPAAVRAPA